MKLITLRQPYVPAGAVEFLQSNDISNKTFPGSDGTLFTDVTCYRCQSMGHYAVNWPSSMSSTHVGFQYIQLVLTMAQAKNGTSEPDLIKPNWLLLDICSTINSFKNKNNLKYPILLCRRRTMIVHKHWSPRLQIHCPYGDSTFQGFLTTIIPLQIFHNFLKLRINSVSYSTQKSNPQ